MKKCILLLVVFSWSSLFANEKLANYKIEYEVKRKQFQKSITTMDMQKNSDQWLQFVEKKLSEILKNNEKNKMVTDLNNQWNIYRDEYWKVLDLKFKKSLGSSSSVDHVRAKIEFLSNHIESLWIILD